MSIVQRLRHTYEVRYDEVNLYGFVTPTAMLRYLQDIAGLHASRFNAGESGYWVARRTIIEFLAPIAPRATLQVETFSLGLTKVTGLRGYEVRLVGENETEARADPVIKARTLWVYLDARGRPARVPQSFFGTWQPEGPRPLQQEEAALPALPTNRPPFVATAPVRFSDLDVMSHMNNAAYVELLDNAAWEALAQIGVLPDGGAAYPVPLHYDIEYVASARAAEMLEVHSWFEPVEGQESQFERLQQVEREGTVLVRARSRWYWQTSAENSTLPNLQKLWK